MTTAHPVSSDQSPAPTIVRKARTSSYVLDKPKIDRMLSILEQRYQDKQLSFESRYDVKLKNEKTITLSSSSELFFLDNSLKNPITELTITTEDSKYPFCPQTVISYDSDRTNNVLLKVTSVDAKWSNEVFAEIEEQIERTLVNDWIRRIFLGDSVFSLNGCIYIMTVMVSVALLFSLFFTVTDSTTDITVQLLQEARNATTDEDKIDFIFKYNKNQLESAQRTNRPIIEWQSVLNINTLFMLLPIIIVVSCIFYLLRYCYPQYVFLWGDYEEHFNNIVSRRQFLWSVVIIAIFIGMVISLFSIGIAPFLTNS